MKKRVLAVCGKGGVGKTSVTAMIGKMLLDQKDVRTLLVDADPAGGLTMALDLPPRRTVEEVRRQTIQEIQQGQTDKQDLAASLDYLLLEALSESRNLAFLAVGRPEEMGCYCSVNRLLQEAIELLAEKFAVTVIDAEAGIEQINREVMRSIDFLLLVSDPTMKGLRVTETIRQVAKRICGTIETGLLLNRVRSAEEAQEFKSKTELNLIGWLPEDETIRRFDAEGRSFLDLPDCAAYRAIHALRDRLVGSD